MTIHTAKRVGLMLDLETLGTQPRSVITQIAFISFDEDDPETILRETEEYLPIQPQLALGRMIDASTLIWWMGQEDAARARFNRNSGDDFEELNALVASVTRKIREEREGADQFTLYARGPQFDVIIYESIIRDLGLEAPHKYNEVSDLRTIMKEAGLSTNDVPLRPGLTKHHGLSDCRYQIDCLVAARRMMRSSAKVSAA